MSAPGIVARVLRSTSEVVNIEVATPEWVRAQGVDEVYLYVTETEATGPAIIGGLWHHPTGTFTPPPTAEEYRHA